MKSERRVGYRGAVTLVSPQGERVTVEIPGRNKWHGGKVRLSNNISQAEKKDQRFRDLLSAGWKVVRHNEAGEDKVREEEKKNTDIVIATTKTGNQSHGGDHASCEVKDSPNRAKRGCRGGRGKKGPEKKRQRKANLKIQVQSCAQKGDVAVYSPQPLQVTPELIVSAEESAKLLGELVGKSQFKVKRGITIDSEKLLLTLELGDNPLPALETPDERPKIKILVTPDCSGSCQSWSGLAQAWAIHLAGTPDMEIIYINNANGDFWEVDEAETKKLVDSVDVVLYLGDGDGAILCDKHASRGATVLALDSYCANYANPRLRTTRVGQGTVHWVSSVHAQDPVTWTKALMLCLKK